MLSNRNTLQASLYINTHMAKGSDCPKCFIAYYSQNAVSCTHFIRGSLSTEMAAQLCIVLTAHLAPPAGYSPDAVSYTTLIRALSWLGRSEDALQAFKELDANPNAQADLYAYNAIISALSVAGRMEVAEDYLRQAAQLAQAQSEPAPVEAFGAIIKVCCCL